MCGIEIQHWYWLKVLWQHFIRLQVNEFQLNITRCIVHTASEGRRNQKKGTVRKASKIMGASTHNLSTCFQILPSGRRYTGAIFIPTAIRLLNKHCTDLHNTFWCIIQCKMTNFGSEFTSVTLACIHFKSPILTVVFPFIDWFGAISSVNSKSYVIPCTKVSNWTVPDVARGRTMTRSALEPLCKLMHMYVGRNSSLSDTMVLRRVVLSPNSASPIGLWMPSFTHSTC